MGRQYNDLNCKTIKSAYIILARSIINLAVKDAKGCGANKVSAIYFLQNMKKKHSYENLIYECAKLGAAEAEKIEKRCGIEIEVEK